jgi:hypothetical protein
VVSGTVSLSYSHLIADIYARKNDFEMTYFCIKEVLKYVVPRLPGTRRLLICVVGKLKTLHDTNPGTLKVTMSKQMLVGKVFVLVGYC